LHIRITISSLVDDAAPESLAAVEADETKLAHPPKRDKGHLGSARANLLNHASSSHFFSFIFSFFSSSCLLACLLTVSSLEARYRLSSQQKNRSRVTFSWLLREELKNACVLGNIARAPDINNNEEPPSFVCLRHLLAAFCFLYIFLLPSYTSLHHPHAIPRIMIQDFTNATGLVYYWGYGNRILPCKNDAGSCEYLEAIYHGHQLSVLYSWIMWVVIAALLLLALTIQLFTRFAPTSSRIDGESKSASRGGLYRGTRGFLASFRRRLLPESLAGMFGHVSRVQLLALAGICAYLFIFTMVGIVYKKWVTPIKKSTLHNTRTGLGPWSDRIGIMAYALTPLTLLLASRESLLSLVTGIPHHHFMFLHRWSGRIIYVQSALHTIGWTVIEAKLYQPQPTVYKTLMAHQYIIFGVVAMLFLTFLTIFSTTAVIKRTGYEFFRKTHLIIATLYIGACWGHWDLLQCWMIASFAILAIDMGSRWIRFGLIHTGFKNGSHGKHLFLSMHPHSY